MKRITLVQRSSNPRWLTSAEPINSEQPLSAMQQAAPVSGHPLILLPPDKPAALDALVEA